MQVGPGYAAKALGYLAGKGFKVLKNSAGKIMTIIGKDGKAVTKEVMEEAITKTGGCFIAGTPVQIVDPNPIHPYVIDSVKIDASEFDTAPLRVGVKSNCLPIERVAIGMRVPRIESQPTAPEPEPIKSECRVVCYTINRTTGERVEVELLRSESWIRQQGFYVGKQFDVDSEELTVTGTATIHEIRECPAIQESDGNVIVGRFVTHSVSQTIRILVENEHNESEQIEGTALHPVWSVDRKAWVRLGDLQTGETVVGSTTSLRVKSVETIVETQPVYNIEVHGQHVYEVGRLGLLVHNNGGNPCAQVLGAPNRVTGDALKAARTAFAKAKPQAWIDEAAKNPGKYTKDQLERMKKGLAPIGSDGFPMEIHHRTPLAEGGSNLFDNFEFLTRTDHRLGSNYKLNHPNLP